MLTRPSLPGVSPTRGGLGLDPRGKPSRGAQRPDLCKSKNTNFSHSTDPFFFNLFLIFFSTDPFNQGRDSSLCR